MSFQSILDTISNIGEFAAGAYGNYLDIATSKKYQAMAGNSGGYVVIQQPAAAPPAAAAAAPVAAGTPSWLPYALIAGGVGFAAIMLAVIVRR